VTQAVHVEQAALGAVPNARRFERDFRTGVEDPALLFAIGDIETVGFAIVVNRPPTRGVTFSQPKSVRGRSNW